MRGRVAYRGNVFVYNYFLRIFSQHGCVLDWGVVLLRQVEPRGSVLPYVPVGIIVGLVYRRPGLGQQFDERHVPLLRGSEERGPATLQYSIHAHATLAQQLPCTINVPGQGFATTVSERSSFEKQFQKSLKCCLALFVKRGLRWC